MSGTEIAVLVVVVLVVLVVALLLARRAAQAKKRRALKETFGGEYDRTVEETGDPKAAERELAARKRLHDSLELRDLPEESRRRYGAAWTQTQADFVDRPAEAVGDADRLVTEVMRERGYPTDSFDQQAAVLSVEHGETLQRYREAHAISVASADNSATTEQLRQAMVHYRALFAELLGDGEDVGLGKHSSGAVADLRDDVDARDSKHSVDQHSVDQHSADQHSADQHSADQHSAEQHSVDLRAAEEAREAAGKHRRENG